MEGLHNIYIYTHTCMYVCMYECMYVCMYVYIYILHEYMNVYIYINVYTILYCHILLKARRRGGPQKYPKESWQKLRLGVPPIAGWFILLGKIHLEMDDDLGVPPFMETPMYII